MVATPLVGTLTREVFEQFAALPENQHRRLEFINGEMVERVSNEVPGHLTAMLSGFVTVYVSQYNLGYMTSAETGFRIGANDHIPDLAFIAANQRPYPLGETWITVVPDLVLEVKPPTDTYIGLVRKAADYVAAGVRMVWVVLPDGARLVARLSRAAPTPPIGRAPVRR